MPDNKPTDNEIIKAQEYCCEADGCDRGCPLVDKCESPIKTMEEFIKFDLDLINRLQAEKENYSKNNQTMTSDILKLYKELEQAKAENERLKKGWKADVILTANVKAEAYKEFANEIFELFPADKPNTVISRVTVKHILKELVGEK